MMPSATVAFRAGRPEFAWLMSILNSSPAMSLPPPESRIARGFFPCSRTFSNAFVSRSTWPGSWAMSSRLSPLWATDSIS